MEKYRFYPEKITGKTPIYQGVNKYKINELNAGTVTDPVEAFPARLLIGKVSAALAEPVL